LSIVPDILIHETLSDSGSQAEIYCRSEFATKRHAISMLRYFRIRPAIVKICITCGSSFVQKEGTINVFGFCS